MPAIIMVMKSISGPDIASWKKSISQTFRAIMLAPVQAAKAMPVGISLIAIEKNQALAKPKTRYPVIGVRMSKPFTV